MGACFDKVFIPNRAVSAVRAIRTLRRMGIRTVVGFSDADRSSLAVRLADESRRLGPAPSSMSYLDARRIVAAARDAGCDAVYPGSGFLSESADFAERCAAAGLTFVGPPPDVLRRLAHKHSARRALAEAGFDVLPGTEPVRAAEEVLDFGREAGYPLMLKPVTGSGGLGTVRVDAPGDVAAALEHARNVAAIAFGDDAVYAEALVDHASAISIPVLVDAYGDAVHLGEREGSVQRGYGKLLDEAPSVKLDAETRARVGADVARALADMGYVTLGTVEFLRDGDGRLFAIEVNPRIQVEHVVTEMVTGIDLVEQMVRLAAGEPLGLRQGDVQVHGHAVQCRIKAEDPAAGFAPCHGRIGYLRLPEDPHLRCDCGVAQGSDVPLFYDTLLLKLCAHGDDRTAAMNRLAASLDEVCVLGVQTTAAVQRRVLDLPEFVEGTYDTSMVQRRLPALVSAGGAGA